MSTTTSRLGRTRTPTDGEPWLDNGTSSAASRLRTTGRRRSVPYLLLGVLLVLACAGGFVVLSLRSDDRRAVLALGRDVTVGQVLTVADLRQVDISVDPGVAVVGLDQAAMVIGRPMSTSLSAGALLTPTSVGGAAVPTPGQAVAALALKPGQFPPEIAAGTPVSVVAVQTGTTGQTATTAQADNTSRTGATRPAEVVPTLSTTWPAVVTSVTTAANDPTTVVSVELDDDAARQVAAIPAGQLAIVMLPAGSVTGGR